jgi:hypothetical protein
VIRRHSIEDSQKIISRLERKLLEPQVTQCPGNDGELGTTAWFKELEGKIGNCGDVSHFTNMTVFTILASGL